MPTCGHMVGRMSYAATIRLSCISTGRSSSGNQKKSSVSPTKARSVCKSNADYITRLAATETPANVITYGGVDDPVVKSCVTRSDVTNAKRHFMTGIDRNLETASPTKGARISERVIVSLPNDASPHHLRNMVTSMVEEMAADSDARIIAAIHVDDPNNPHVHISIADGLQSRASAEAAAAASGKKRVRQSKQVRPMLADYSEARAMFARHINMSAAAVGHKRAEIRSLAVQGIDRDPQEHEGPTKSRAVENDFQETARRKNLDSAMKRAAAEADEIIKPKLEAMLPPEFSVEIPDPTSDAFVDRVISATERARKIERDKAQKVKDDAEAVPSPAEEVRKVIDSVTDSAYAKVALPRWRSDHNLRARWAADRDAAKGMNYNWFKNKWLAARTAVIEAATKCIEVIQFWSDHDRSLDAFQNAQLEKSMAARDRKLERIRAADPPAPPKPKTVKTDKTAVDPQPPKKSPDPAPKPAPKKSPKIDDPGDGGGFDMGM